MSGLSGRTVHGISILRKHTSLLFWKSLLFQGGFAECSCSLSENALHHIQTVSRVDWQIFSRSVWVCWRALVANIQRLLLVQGFEPVGYWQGYIFSAVNYTYIVSSVTSHGRRTFRKKNSRDVSFWSKMWNLIRMLLIMWLLALVDSLIAKYCWTMSRLTTWGCFLFLFLNIYLKLSWSQRCIEKMIYLLMNDECKRSLLIYVNTIHLITELLVV